MDLLAIAFEALTDEEQAESLARLQLLQATRSAGTDSATARMLASLAQAASHIGGPPTPTSYAQAREELAREGTELEPVSRLTRHFGTWRLAKEALSLSEVTTARQIDARFKRRRLAKVWRYTDDTLEQTLQRCVAELGQLPQVAEFDWWRQRQLELAAAEGNDAFHIPSATPYRKRWGTWEGALRHFGFDPTAIYGRLERQ